MSPIKSISLSIGIIINTVIFYNFYLKYIRSEELIVKELTKDISESITMTLSKYNINLKNIQGIYSIKNNISNEDFELYTNTIDFKKNFKGSLGIGFIRLIYDKDLQSYIKENKISEIYPKVKTDEHMIIELVEPPDANLDLKWLDISYDNFRKEAALTAALKNEFTLTRPVNLSQQYEKSLGFYALLPIFDPKGKNPRYFLKGWAFTTIVLDKFLQELDNKLPNNVKIQIEFDKSDLIYTGGFSKYISESILYKNSYQVTKKIGGYNWKIILTANTSKVMSYIYLLVLLYIIINIIIIYSTNKFINLIVLKNKMLYQKESWFKGVINSSNYLIISTDNAGKILSFNKSAENSLQYKSTDVIGKESPLIFYDKDELEKIANQYHGKNSEILLSSDKKNDQTNLAIVSDKKLNSFEYFILNVKKQNISQSTFVRKDGEKFFVKVLVSSIYDQFENIIGYLFTAEDLTHEIEIQKIINEQKEQMLYTSKFSQLGEMAANIAHEINTPLSVIIMKSYSIKNKLTENNLEIDKLVSDITKIEATTQKIARIVKSLKMYTRNSEKDNYDKISLNNILQSSLDLCQEKITNNGIQLSIQTSENLFTFGKEAELCQVFLNLINNSIDAINNYAEKWINITVTKKENTLILQFTDSGNGIPENIIDKLMNPFFTTKQVGKGTGLGLSISKRIIEMHNGKLYYDRSNKNTTFIIELPSVY
ncbi:ATP-binding protein [Pigmentibacter sp. JX0631]|uniref:ATP-binding protein n=1 Tax=Pigmentibacter sp. JX0631 TaxID=2976982 RepID=UPI002468ECBC|nr:ATP-binding protein [Pigmentibacter sp. JX0631]WGL59673.1 ATP-binding protein [Pigmentibacter sp. JX0631]